MRRSSWVTGMAASGSRRKYLPLALVTIMVMTCLMTYQMTPRTWYVELASDSIVIEEVLFGDASYLADANFAKPPDNEESCDAIKERAELLFDVEWWHAEELSSDVVLQGWEDDWIADGTVDKDANIEPYKMDFVYTYVNSDEKFSNMKEPFDREIAQSKGEAWSKTQASRFRSWEELRYSIRGTLQHASTWLSKIYIVSKDFEWFDETDNSTTHIVQKPQWLDSSLINETSTIQIIPETSIIKNGACGPTFNSISIEASMGNVPLSTNHFVGLSDDMMLGKETSSTDFVSPLLGMSFSWYSNDWAVDEDREPDLNDGELGEGHALRYTSFLLNGRFGRRRRTLQLHQAKVMNQKILNEALRTFPKSAMRTPLSRYRDDSQQVYSWYLHMHFTMEMHREALLWAIAMRCDSNEDGELQVEERAVFLRELEEGIQAKGSRLTMPMLGQLKDKLKDAKLPDFKIQHVTHTSMDGPQQIKQLSFDQCQSSFSVEKCFGPDFATVDEYSMVDFYERLSAPQYGVECGDCLIKYLLNNSKLGLGSLLPKKDGVYRERAIKAIHKYQYTETSPESFFLMVRNVEDAQALRQWAKRMPGLLCINDDVTTTDAHKLGLIGNGYRDFFQIAYPKASDFEKDGNSLKE